ncbi:uncharacterized protein LOC105204503 [Solenopsis invicta]|uniref:uncharacterized protein LOC105204503 n=1 Tax=Solenopsis invicta TaxID=13686 RepID=UPI000595E6A8|nr:uncharacterized protein LOC105204503 [Solenopsis invicta]
MDAALDYFTEMITPMAHNSTMDLSHASNDIPTAPRPISRLPRIDLPTFDGSFERWETFRDRFKSMIINDPSLTNVERLHYLCSSVSGSAGNALSHLTVTDANFDVAWRILSARYENKRRLVNSHLESLWALPAAAHESSKDLQTLLDSADMSIHALKNLGCPVDTWDDILVFLVSQRLDKTTRKAWELKLEQSKEPPSYSDLHVFLESRIRAFEVLAPRKASSATDTAASKAKAVKSISSHATSVKFQCFVCRGDHPLYQCSQFLSYTPERRFEFIKTNKRCYNCLASNHTLKECNNPYRCRECRQKHNTLLHLAKPAESPCEETANATDPTKINTVDRTVSLSIAMPVRTKRAAVLTTARVRVHSPHGRFAVARALIDTGSVVNIISENLEQLLRLPRMKDRVNVSGIGKRKSAAHHAANMMISPATSNEPAYSINAIILPSLSDYALVKVPSSAPLTHLQNLPLADTDFLSSDPIEIVLGSDIYATILRDGIKRGAPDEPIAQNTSLGWILAGSPARSSSINTIHVHQVAIVDDLNTTLRRF